jgi:hypothetical protein
LEWGIEEPNFIIPKMPIATIEIDRLKDRYGNENCQVIGQREGCCCYVLALSRELTLFLTPATAGSPHEVILNVGGVEKDLSRIFLEMNQSLLELCDWIEERFQEDDHDQYFLSDSYSQSSVGEELSSREITIYTWGNSIRKQRPDDSEMNFNAIPIVSLNRRSGFNLKKLNGMNKEIQQCLLQIPKFNTFVSDIVSAINEDPSLECISINCKNGIHRSVAVAEILKSEYFPNARLVHLELGR